MDNSQLLAYTIAYAIKNDREEFIRLLLDNGILLDPETVSDEKLVHVSTVSLADSISFQQNFLSWVESKLENSSNADGATSSGGFWGGGFNAGAVTGLVTTGLNLFGGIKTSESQLKATQAMANAQLAASTAQNNSNLAQLQIAQMNLEAAKLKPSGASNTTLYIVIAFVGLIAIGGVVYAVTKK